MNERNILAVVAWMAGALFAFSATAVAVRELAGKIGVFDILAIRYGAGLVTLAVVAAAIPRLRPALVPRRLGLHLGRNLIHFTGTFAWSLGVTLLPLATVFALEFTTPAWVAVLAPLVLGEALTRGRIAAIVSGILGVLVILRPGAEAVQPAALIVLGGAIAFAGASVTTKSLTRVQGTFTILFWMNLIQLPLALAGSALSQWSALGAEDIGALLGIAVGGLASHWCLTNAYRHGDALTVIPLDFLRIPLIALVGWQIYGEALDPMVFAGAALIIMGIVWNLRSESRSPPALPRAGDAAVK